MGKYLTELLLIGSGLVEELGSSIDAAFVRNIPFNLELVDLVSTNCKSTPFRKTILRVMSNFLLGYENGNECGLRVHLY